MIECTVVLKCKDLVEKRILILKVQSDTYDNFSLCNLQEAWWSADETKCVLHEDWKRFME